MGWALSNLFWIFGIFLTLQSTQCHCENTQLLKIERFQAYIFVTMSGHYWNRVVRKIHPSWQRNVFKSMIHRLESNLTEMNLWLIILTPGEECKVIDLGMSVCLYVWSVRAHNSKTIAPIDFIFYTRSIVLLARSYSKIIRIGIQIWSQEFIKGFFTIAR